jgi:hypothetical protein
MKLEDGVRLHESVKVELETYARETDQPIVKPFVLVIARDTTHAKRIVRSDSIGTFSKAVTRKGHSGGFQQDGRGGGRDD